MSKEEEIKNDLGMDLFSEPYVDLGGEDDLLFFEENNEEPSEVENDENQNNDEEVDNTLENVVEDQEEVEENDESNDDNVDTESSSTDPNLFSSLATLLLERGLISSTDSDLKIEEITDEDKFANLIKSEIQKSEFSDLNDNQKEYLTKLRNGIPEEEVKEYINESSQLNSITDEMISDDSELRKQIIYQDLINKGFSNERARKNLQRSIELESDIEDAKEALESIKDFSKEKFKTKESQIKAAKLKQEEIENQRLSNIKTRIKNTTEVIKGIQITDNIKEKIESTMFNPISEDPSTGMKENALMKYRRENAEEFDYKLYYLFTVTDGFKNFDFINKKTRSSVIGDLDRALKSSTKIKDTGSPAYLQDPNSYGIDIQGHELVID